MSRVEYCNRDTGLHLPSQSQCMQFVQEHVVPDMLKMTDGSPEMSFRRVTKNDNIKQAVERLYNDSSPVTCIFAYGPHIQKMLSILEICKKALAEQNQGELHQWNRLACFVLIEEGRNDLVECRRRVPILVSIVTKTVEAASQLQLEMKGFTRQS
ncbi:POP6 (YGR030C) [Zygosaccharomyces parabailii]|uniref:BN860_07360g1_1 n=1 Tax=Zygosaccharomyces bailii (strain CLIB 213 / ATCC 58445 / CBS 680 / BCRC 21525 / NBRC 1098 / NCYC 1416 / NRRL Y-2227) TaxID=1333698 RepID=A0A8J2T4Y3_ZYGB2|nr:POP6 (YGR030C) [Zygosaccharomyces parabailii]CDF88321.1 BN860_07360g1_1 [Zygosaccharomyces bailii CLIB 213]